ncbi:VOC family protein [Dyella psychrodurans]|uniref:VOC family protein n=1 Tax=Dyella psychrodurans TaxID=1927960 RepID=A0A370WZF2_9GAMM|nr:VOC family protein [Dyella psychrodurans]RDS81410.1 VOC family protein [Dyella psychrodurans]
MTSSATPFLMFGGSAEEAMRFYTSLCPDSAITAIERYGPREAGVEGSVKKATFTVCGRSFMCIDSAVKHDFSFTPALSIFVDLDDETGIEHAFCELANGGKVFMPLNNYGFSRKFAWVSDRFGVSWQLNLAA